MAKPLSLDLRLRIAAALTEGLTARAAAKRFGVSAASAVRMGQLARSGKGLAARRMGGHRQPVLAPVCAAITARLAQKTDWAVKAWAADLTADGALLHRSTKGPSCPRHWICIHAMRTEIGRPSSSIRFST